MKPAPGLEEVGDGAGVTVLPSTLRTKGVKVGRVKSWVGMRMMVAVALGLGVLVIVEVLVGSSVRVAVGIGAAVEEHAESKSAVNRIRARIESFIPL